LLLFKRFFLSAGLGLFLERPVPPGTIDWLLYTRLAARERRAAKRFDRPSWTDIFFCLISRHFVPGYYHRVPPGPIYRIATGALIHRDYGDKFMSAKSESPAQKLIQHFKMEKIPAEGPWFTVTYRSEDLLPANGLPARYQGNRVAGTAIHAVQTKEDFSAIHKLATDEIWHFYGGDPLEMLLLYPDGHGQIVVLGSDVFRGQSPQFVVHRDVWQGSRPMGAEPESYSFFGNTLAPGFEFDDFEMGYRDELQEKYPEFASHIEGLTRAEFIARQR